MRCLTDHSAAPEDLIAAHVARPVTRPDSRGFVRLNMISSADGATAFDGTSGGLGNRNDHAVFAALRENADAVRVGMVTAVAEQYRAPEQPDLRVFVIAKEPDISGNPELFTSGRATIVLPEDAPPTPAGVGELRAGTGGRVDLAAIVDHFKGQLVLMEGGPGLAGVMVSLGLIDEFFHTVAPKVISLDPASVGPTRRSRQSRG